MKLIRVLPLMVLLFLGACAGPTTESEPAEEPAPAAEAEPQLTPEEQVAQMASGCAEAAEAMEQRHAAQPLYERLGGREGIETFVVEMLRLHQENPDVAPFFEGVDVDTFVENATDFIASGTGGTEEYEGGDVPAVHAHMSLTHADFLAAGGDIEMALTNVGIAPDERQEVMCALVSMRWMVLPGVEEPATDGETADG